MALTKSLIRQKAFWRLATNQSMNFILQKYPFKGEKIMLATQLKYDLLMFSRELFYLVFTIIVPPVTYLFMGQLFGDQTYAGNLSYAQTYTPSFILLITFGCRLFRFWIRSSDERTTGVEKRINLSPVSKKTLLLSSILKSIIITSFGFSLFIYRNDCLRFIIPACYVL